MFYRKKITLTTMSRDNNYNKLSFCKTIMMMTHVFLKQYSKVKWTKERKHTKPIIKYHQTLFKECHNLPK